MGGVGSGDRESREKKEEDSNAKDCVAVKRNKLHQALSLTYVHIL